MDELKQIVISIFCVTTIALFLVMVGIAKLFGCEPEVVDVQAEQRVIQERVDQRAAEGDRAAQGKVFDWCIQNGIIKPDDLGDRTFEALSRTHELVHQRFLHDYLQKSDFISDRVYQTQNIRGYIDYHLPLRQTEAYVETEADRQKANSEFGSWFEVAKYGHIPDWPSLDAEVKSKLNTELLHAQLELKDHQEQYEQNLRNLRKTLEK